MKTILAVIVATVAVSPAIAAPQAAQPIAGPQYTASALVSSADSLPTDIAPNTIVTLAGQNLSFDTAALLTSEIQNATMPTELPLTGVHVYVGGIMAAIYYSHPPRSRS